MAAANITVIGSLNIDHIFFVDRLPKLGESYEAERYEKALGGKGANAAIAAYRSCHRQSETNSEPGEKSGTDIHVRMVGAVGDDFDGTWMRETLRNACVDESGVATVKGITGMTFIIVEEPEEPENDEATRDNRLIYTIGANASLQSSQFTKVEDLSSNGTRPDLIISQLEIARGTVEAILKTAHSAGIKVLLNAAPANDMRSEFYCYVTHLLVNETEAAMLYGCEITGVKKETWEEIATFFLEFGVENFVITLGAKGAFFATYKSKSPDSDDPREIFSRKVDAFQVDEVVDPTGAGDTFTGVYAAEYIRQSKENEPWDIERAVRTACAAGALTVTRAGAQDGIPWLDEIADFIREAEKEALDAVSDKDRVES